MFSYFIFIYFLTKAGVGAAYFDFLTTTSFKILTQLAR